MEEKGGTELPLQELTLEWSYIRLRGEEKGHTEMERRGKEEKEDVKNLKLCTVIIDI